MQACLESLEKAVPAVAKLRYRTSPRTEGQMGGKVHCTDWANLGKFDFSLWASLYAGDAATPMASRMAHLAGTNAMYPHLRPFRLLMRVGSPGKKSKTEAIYCPARVSTYGDGDSSDMVLDCGSTVSFTKSFAYLGSLLHFDL